MRKTAIVTLVLTVTAPMTGITHAEILVGQLAMNEARIDGAPAPTGTSVISPSRVQTGDAPSVVYLSTGAQLYLGPNSGAELAATESGDIEVAAITGLVQLGDGEGDVLTLAHNSLAVADQEGNVEVDPGQRACVLVSSGSHSTEECAADRTLEGCEWAETTVGYLEEGDVFFVPERRPDESRRPSCQEAAARSETEKGGEDDDGVPAWVWAVGGTAVLIAVAEASDDDDVPRDVSPSQP